MTRRLLPEVAAVALGGVLVARPAAQVRHVAVTAGLTSTGRLRRVEAPLCGRTGRAWSTRRGTGLPLCRVCDHRARALADRDALIAAARALTAHQLAAVLLSATDLEQVETVAGLLVADPALRLARVEGHYGNTVLQRLVAQERGRLAPQKPLPRRLPRHAAPAGAPVERLSMFPTRFPAAARRRAS